MYVGHRHSSDTISSRSDLRNQATKKNRKNQSQKKRPKSKRPTHGHTGHTRKRTRELQSKRFRPKFTTIIIQADGQTRRRPGRQWAEIKAATSDNSTLCTRQVLLMFERQHCIPHWTTEGGAAMTPRPPLPPALYNGQPQGAPMGGWQPGAVPMVPRLFPAAKVTH